MATQSIEDQIQEKVQSFAEELSGLVRAAALEAVEQVLGGYVTHAAAGKPRPARARAKQASARAGGSGKRVRRTAAALESDMAGLQAYISAHPGQRLEEIAVGMKVDSKGLKRPITLLLQAKQLRKEGQRRGTRYFSAGRGGPAKKAASKATRKKKVARKAAAKKKVTRKGAAKKKVAAKS